MHLSPLKKLIPGDICSNKLWTGIEQKNLKNSLKHVYIPAKFQYDEFSCADLRFSLNTSYLQLVETPGTNSFLEIFFFKEKLIFQSQSTKKFDAKKGNLFVLFFATSTYFN